MYLYLQIKHKTNYLMKIENRIKLFIFILTYNYQIPSYLHIIYMTSTKKA